MNKNFNMTLAVCLSLFAGAAISTKAQKAELVVQMGHSNNVESVSFSSDGKTLASAGGSLESEIGDNTIKLWDVESGRELRTLTGHSGSVNSVSFSSVGRTLASGSSDHTIKLWDVESGQELRTLTGHSSFVRSVAFSSDGRTLASGSDDNTIKLWNVESGQELRTLTGHSDSVLLVSFSSDGETLASSSEGYDYRSGYRDKTIKLWNVESGKELRTFTVPSILVYSVSFSSGGILLAGSGLYDKTIKLWDVTTGKELRALTGHSSFVESVSFSSDGKTLASASIDKTIKLWDVATGKELRTLTGHWQFVNSLSFSSDGITLVTAGGFDKMIELFDVATGKELRTLTGHSSFVESVSFSSDGKTLASGGRDNRIRLWDLESGKELRFLTGHSAWVNSISFSSDGKVLASGSDDDTIRLWDVESGKTLRTLTASSTVESVAFNSDGTTLASSGGSGWEIRLWDVQSGKELRTLSGQDGPVVSVAFSSDGKTLASGNSGRTITLWNLETGKELKTLTADSSSGDLVSFRPARNRVSFSKDGKTLASSGRGSGDTTIKLWEVESGKELRTFTGHSSPVRSVALSSDGKTLASGSSDTTIKLWDIETGKELRTLTGHSSFVESVSFSSDGRTLASGGGDGKTKIWNVATGKEVCSLIALDENDWVVTTPEGRFDTNKIEDSQGLHWVVSDDPLKPIPLEIFMRDYYEPKLLQRILKCTEDNTCDQVFKPLPNIAELNRVQPPVKITSVSLPDANRRVEVTVEVGKGVVPRTDCRMKRCESGVYDLRLFRDGQIVGTYPGAGQAEFIRQSESLQTAIAEKDLWRKVSAIALNKTVGCKTGAAACGTQTFAVELPKGKDAADIEFTAYAFNEDRVKSQNAKWEWPADVIAKLPKAQAIKPRAYVIAVGVNAYENQDFDLEFAADDARRMAEVVTEKLNATGQYEKVIPVTLISDYETRESGRIVTEKQATKDKFHAVLKLLAGENVGGQLLEGVKNADQLQRATPDDLVLIMYSSHGYADRAGNFYFIPYDTGSGTGKLFTETVRRHSISSDELSLWLRNVDAGEMIMIVDACHSAAAIEGSDFKPGPMGSRGLGQLAYDKGMKILTATQADNVALENNLIKQGLLTYALVQDGIEARQADYKPPDNVINFGEWLSYGVDRVPKLYEEVQAGKIQDFGILAGRQTKVVVADQIGKSTKKTLEDEVAAAKAQQPSLFDFTRRRREVALVNKLPVSK